MVYIWTVCILVRYLLNLLCVRSRRTGEGDTSWLSLGDCPALPRPACLTVSSACRGLLHLLTTATVSRAWLCLPSAGSLSLLAGLGDACGLAHVPGAFTGVRHCAGCGDSEVRSQGSCPGGAARPGFIPWGSVSERSQLPQEILRLWKQGLFLAQWYEPNLTQRCEQNNCLISFMQWLQL